MAKVYILGLYRPALLLYYFASIAAMVRPLGARECRRRVTARKEWNLELALV